MSGPQGSDPSQQWPGQEPEAGKEETPSEAAGSPWQAPTSGSDQPAPETPAWQPPAGGAEQPAAETPAAQSWQPPAYTPQQYPYQQQPGQPAYQPQQYPEQFGQQPAGYPYPPQYGQQPGQPGQPGQFGQPPTQFGQYGQQPPFGQYPPGYPQPGPGGEKPKPSMTVIGGAVGALVVLLLLVVGVLGFWKPGFFVTTKLDVNAAQTGVQQILTDEANGYGAKNVKNVKCNQGESPTVKKGDTFDCEVSIDGTKRQVTVTFQDDKGTYEVGRPK